MREVQGCQRGCDGRHCLALGDVHGGVEPDRSQRADWAGWEAQMTENGPGRVVELDQAALYYEEHGDGPPLILIHGGLSTGAFWAPVTAELAAVATAPFAFAGPHTSLWPLGAVLVPLGRAQHRRAASLHAPELARIRDACLGVFRGLAAALELACCIP